MPRTGALLSLSREHHTSLVLARAIKKVINDDDQIACQEMAKRIEMHWHTLLAAHFAYEELLLQRAKEILNPESIARIFAEHAEIRMLADESSPIELPERLHRFAELIVTHVRYEERVLFPQLQAHPCITFEALFHSTDHVEKDPS